VLDQILDRLVNVKKSGTNKWIACCPVHEDKTPSMGVWDEGERIIMHCLGCGAKGPEIMGALSMPVRMLFKGDDSMPAGYVPKAVIEKAKEAVYFVDIFESEVRKGHDATLAEKRQNRKSKQLKRLLDETDNKGRVAGNGVVVTKIGSIPEAFR
jgi:hypothetical protein